MTHVQVHQLPCNYREEVFTQRGLYNTTCTCHLRTTVGMRDHLAVQRWQSLEMTIWDEATVLARDERPLTEEAGCQGVAKGQVELWNHWCEACVSGCDYGFHYGQVVCDEQMRGLKIKLRRSWDEMVS